MSSGTIHLHGSRTSQPPTGIHLDAGPDFMTNPDRRCAQVDADIFYSASDIDQGAARSVCGPCDFRKNCLIWALKHKEVHGVWGGVLMSSAVERKKAAAELGLDTTPAPASPAAPETGKSTTRRRVERQRLEQAVAENHRLGRDDGVIAVRLGISRGGVAQIRRRLGLPCHAGPGGRRLDHTLAS